MTRPASTSGSAAHTDAAMTAETWTAPEVRARQWIVSDDVGTSSKAIWARMMGVGARHGCDSYPHDPADLGRCLRLLGLIPEWKPRIGEMAQSSIHWARLCSRWTDLEICMDREVGIDWSKGRRAPVTYDFMRAILDGRQPPLPSEEDMAAACRAMAAQSEGAR